MRGWLATLLVLVGLVAGGRAAAAPDAVGVNTHVPAPAVVDLVAEAGMSWIRVDNNWFEQQDPCGASVGFIPPLDTAVAYAVSHGLCVYMTIAYTPACASLGDSDGTHNNDVPDPAKWAAYVRQTVQHYRAMGVRHFGLWNEPDLTGFWEGTADQYVTNILVPGFPAVRAGCQDAGHDDCLVLGPELAHVGTYDVFLEATLNALKSHALQFDILTHHIYQSFDTPVYSGDSFLNALEQRRFAFTRRSFLDVLKDTGNAPGGVPYAEVWITETGYQCQPATDATQMANQATHIGKVLDAQLARDWWTNSFFYEILDSGDSLDGYGITRSQGGGSYLRKPAFDLIESRIAGDARLRSGGCAPVAVDGGAPDAATAIDAALPTTDSGADAAVSADAGTPGGDAGAPDRPAGAGDGGPADGPAAADSSSGGSAPGGCGCRAGARGSALAALALLVGLMWRSRRPLAG